MQKTMDSKQPVMFYWEEISKKYYQVFRSFINRKKNSNLR